MPKKRNEVTGKAVASIAGRILKRLDRHAMFEDTHVFTEHIERERDVVTLWKVDAVCTVEELRALAASALTQREDRPYIQTQKHTIDAITKRKPARKVGKK